MGRPVRPQNWGLLPESRDGVFSRAGVVAREWTMLTMSVTLSGSTEKYGKREELLILGVARMIWNVFC